MGELDLINPFERNTVIKKPSENVVESVGNDTRQFLAELPEELRLQAHRAIFEALADSALGMEQPVLFTDIMFQGGQMVEIPRIGTLGEDLRRQILGTMSVAEYLEQV